MAEPMELAARFLHITFAILWVGTLATLATVIIPAAQGKREHAPNLGPIVARLGHTRWFGVLTVLVGAWLVTASGHTWSELGSPPWGDLVLGALLIALVMMGLEHGLAHPQLEKAHTAPADERAEHLKKASWGALGATLLGILAVLVMVGAGLGGF